IEEAGGAAALKRRVGDHFVSGPDDDELWLVAELDGEPVGLAGASELDKDEAVLEGVYVLPEHRGRGIGSALMDATLAGISTRTRRLVVLETVAALVGDTPSVRMYRRSGARLRATYMHLQADSKGAWEASGPEPVMYCKRCPARPTVRSHSRISAGRASLKAALLYVLRATAESIAVRMPGPGRTARPGEVVDAGLPHGVHPTPHAHRPRGMSES
ncbi:MAG: GNAT family N-acetyltransferase, partial [Chloroflexota bacterium]|nr:GNAT family N-acetyltransferase [Chloroflexota bacterium]